MQGRSRTLIVCLLLALSVLVVYWRAFSYERFNLDDAALAFDNKHVRAGLTWPSVRWAFEISDHDWVPLANLSYMAEVELHGLDPRGCHATNILFHLANTLLLFAVVRSMTGAFWRSALVAALFALHPLRVESVVWIAERRDVLSTFFGLLAIMAYVGYARRPGIGRYAWIMLFLALSLLSKQMLVTLPFALLLLDYWPMRRFGDAQPAPQALALPEPPSREASPREASAGDAPANVAANLDPRAPLAPPFARRSFRWLVLEKLPLLMLSAADIAIVLKLLRGYSGAYEMAQQIPLADRVANLLQSYVNYLQTTLVPRGLAVHYPFPTHFSAWSVAGATLLLAGITGLALWQIRRRAYLAIGWFWFLGILFPTMGLLAHNNYARADRYTYVPSIGLCLVLAWGGWELASKLPRPRAAAAAAAAAALVALMLISTWYVALWRESINVWRHALNVTDENSTAYNNVGALLFDQRQLDPAIWHFEMALRYMSDGGGVHNNLAVALMAKGDYARALHHFQAALKGGDMEPQIYHNVGKVYLNLGRFEDAIAQLRLALDREPEDAGVIFDLGRALLAAQQTQPAIEQFRRALELRPGWADAYNNLGVALMTQKRYELAAEHFAEALRLDPGNAYARQNHELANRLIREGGAPDANPPSLKPLE